MKGKLILSVAEAEDHDKWLAVRDLGIGGSDAAVIVGLNPYKKPYKLWAEKTGQAEPDDLSENEAVYFGTVLEEIVAREFCKRNNKKVKRCGTLQDEEFPFMLANIDRWVVGENAGLECKTANGFKAKEWEDENAPAHYILQCQWYMGITGAERWYLACLVGGQHFVCHTIERNEADIGALRQAVYTFWNGNVLTNMPPELDGSEGTTAALAAKYDAPNGSECMLPAAAAALIAQLDELAVTKKVIAEQEEAAKNGLKDLLGNFEVGLFNDRKVTWKATKPRTTIDSKKLQAEFPAAYAACAKPGKPSRTFKLN